MATWWVTELDIEVTALLPLATFPLFNIAALSKILPPYAADVIFPVDGRIYHRACDRGLGPRPAHRLFHSLRLVGARPGAIMGGSMAVTAFLSMWVSSTASRR